MKRLLLIPGFGETTRDHPYQKLMTLLKADYEIEVYNPKWRYGKASKWIRALETKLPEGEDPDTTIVAFSLGAFIALNLASKHAFRKVLLCSVSPLFAPQLHHLPQTARTILGKRRVQDFGKYSIPKHTLSKLVFLFGDKDWNIAIKEANSIAGILNSKFVIVKDTAHELTDNYIKEILKTL